MTARVVVAAAIVASLGGVWGCGDDGEGAASRPEVSPQLVLVPGAVPPPNPVTGTATPAELNFARALVYQHPSRGDGDVQFVVVCVPGFLGGANDFDYLARRLIARSDGRIALWAVDRRSNALEDHWGLDQAEREKNPDIAKAYYFQGAEVAGKRFQGFLRAEQLRFLSEWGLRVHIEDLHALLREVWRRYPRAAIFLAGHSLGASIAPIFAAWDFGPYAGFELLSGLILLEGAPNAGATPPSQQAYETTGVPGGLSRVSLQSLRNGNPVSSLEPFVSTDLFVTAEILGMRAAPEFGQANTISPDADLYRGFFTLLFGSTVIPPATNRAALGFGFDNDFQPLAFARVSVGSATGGTVGPNPNAGLLSQLLGAVGNLLAPLDASATYTWSDAAADDPGRVDPTRLETFGGLLFRGPTNFIEWYFPARLTLDVGVVTGLNVSRSEDWRLDQHGLAVTENARVDVPVFAVGGSRGLLANLERLRPYRDSLAPALRSGVARDRVADGFRTMLMENYVHLDVLTADDERAGGNGLFAAVVEWLRVASQLAPRRGDLTP
ncbi:MAG: lipase family protein [Candidatus Binatia bacterium]|nr:lipase family protein [Candidatus Binatia bacterium]